MLIHSNMTSYQAVLPPSIFKSDLESISIHKGGLPCHKTTSTTSQENSCSTKFLRGRNPPQRIMTTPNFFPRWLFFKKLSNHSSFNIPRRNSLPLILIKEFDIRLLLFYIYPIHKLNFDTFGVLLLSMYYMPRNRDLDLLQMQTYSQ